MKPLLLSAIFSCLLCINGAAWASPVTNTPYLTAAKCAISAAQASQIARKKYGGKVIDVKAINLKGRRAYRVKILQKSGRIHSVIIDAANGRPMG
ncbi:PepSY domain-containing protein [Gilvimarinus agarilyticus]|uniref:PepSY domain-containing protein n=1 Tax=unclassified Gilvimarinus TaxID=2642066 RepID=UPI001C084D7C|nr:MULTISPECIES: PepSY domain-containing protein [unclassified Gilvimarinus]MBU2887622.1 PepSY domain-containing protein [Gilvimarinus agarilyticus]MDO6572273.1 PepSY domain-containing protein [Gilvimarinus sp. 2_MG-2023]MDO6746840.1 PepSY domain-containing protein [Gilvimarinus sp. 1_MG-2023]